MSRLRLYKMRVLKYYVENKALFESWKWYISLFAKCILTFFIVFNLRIMLSDTYIWRCVPILYFCILLYFYCFIWISVIVNNDEIKISNQSMYNMVLILQWNSDVRCPCLSIFGRKATRVWYWRKIFCLPRVIVHLGVMQISADK